LQLGKTITHHRKTAGGAFPSTFAKKLQVIAEKELPGIKGSRIEGGNSKHKLKATGFPSLRIAVGSGAKEIALGDNKGVTLSKSNLTRELEKNATQ